MSGRRETNKEWDEAANFRTTHWSIVVAAGQEWSPLSEEALTKLCQLYWKPVCAFIRRRGCDPETAKDLTQAFFLRLIKKPDFLQTADQERGRFRSFLLTTVRNFLANAHEREQALKRGGGVTFVPLDGLMETQWLEEPANEMSPEKAFDQRWALTLVQQAMGRLEREYAETGKSDQFAVMQEFLPGGKDADVSYAQAARQLHSSETAVRQAAHRLRGRFRDLLRAEVGQTVATQAEVEDELSYLLTALGG